MGLQLQIISIIYHFLPSSIICQLLFWLTKSMKCWTLVKNGHQKNQNTKIFSLHWYKTENVIKLDLRSRMFAYLLAKWLKQLINYCQFANKLIVPIVLTSAMIWSSFMYPQISLWRLNMRFHYSNGSYITVFFWAPSLPNQLNCWALSGHVVKIISQHPSDALWYKRFSS